MTSMQVTPTGAAETANERIRRTARALQGAFNIKNAQMCMLLGISKATWEARMNGSRQFGAGEVAEMAKYFGVRVQDFYDGRVVLPEHRGPDPDDQRGHRVDSTGINACTSRRSSGFLRLLAGGGETIGAPRTGGYLQLAPSIEDQDPSFASGKDLLGIA